MKSIQRRFENFKEKNENLGDYIILMKAVKDQGFNRGTISRWFKKLVGKDDYDRSDKKSLIDQLARASNPLEDNGFSPKTARH